MADNTGMTPRTWMAAALAAVSLTAAGCAAEGPSRGSHLSPTKTTEVDPATGQEIPAAGSAAYDDMERREIECFDSGRTDCADNLGGYLNNPGSYP